MRKGRKGTGYNTSAMERKTQYIVFDLEWNQSSDGTQGSVPEMPFEIIEIGAVRLDETLKPAGEFTRFIRPAVYKKLHFKVHEIMRVGMSELKKRGEPFPDVFREFLDWCLGTEDGTPANPVFCTWGSMDLTELRRNVAYHGLEDPFPYPLLYYDLQKLYNRLYKENSKNKLPLDKAVRELGIPEEHPFHRALDDARYTGEVMRRMDFDAVRDYLSLDYYRLPVSSEEEIYLVFPDYAKYVSRAFPTREDAIADKTVTDMLCYRCNRMLRKKIRWFTANQRNYYCLSLCPEHGFVRGKIKMKHAPGGEVYAIKTVKIVGDNGAEDLRKKKEEVQGRRKRIRQKHRRGEE